MYCQDDVVIVQRGSQLPFETPKVIWLNEEQNTNLYCAVGYASTTIDRIGDVVALTALYTLGNTIPSGVRFHCLVIGSRSSSASCHSFSTRSARL